MKHENHIQVPNPAIPTTTTTTTATAIATTITMTTSSHAATAAALSTSTTATTTAATAATFLAKTMQSSCPLPQDVPPSDMTTTTTTMIHADTTIREKKTKKRSMTSLSFASPSNKKKKVKDNSNSSTSSNSCSHNNRSSNHTEKRTRESRRRRHEEKFEMLKENYSHIFCPLDIKACTLLYDEDYILSFVALGDAFPSSSPAAAATMLMQGRLEDLLLFPSSFEGESYRRDKQQQKQQQQEETCRVEMYRHDGARQQSQSSSSSSPPSLNWTLIQQLTRILIDAMGFQIQDRQPQSQSQPQSQQEKNNDPKGGSDYILQPIEDKVPSERPSSFKNLVDLQIAILKSSSYTKSSSSSSSSSSFLSECRIMQDIALAYRLAAHFMLKACHEWSKQQQQQQQQQRQKYQDKSLRQRNKVVKKIQNRAALTLFVSLRSLYVDLLRHEEMGSKIKQDEEEDEKRMASSCPVTKNICHFFRAKEDERTNLTPAQVLLLDCVTLLTDVDDDIIGGSCGGGGGSVGMMEDHKRCMALVEKLLKLAKEFGEREDLGVLWGGIMELVLRQLLATEAVFVGNQGPIRKYLDKLSQRHSAVSGALASVLEDMTLECKVAMEEILELRKGQLKRMGEVRRRRMSEQHVCAASNSGSGNSAFLHPMYDQDTAKDSLMSEDMHKLRMHGCIYLTKVFSVYASQHQRPNHLGGQRLRDHVEQMAFYLFHFLMENDPSSQKTDEGSVHPFSIAVRVNVKSAALAALFLSTKINDCPVSMRRLIALSNSVTGDVFLKSFEGTESGVPYQNLIKTYERHLMMLHGYDAPEISCLPFSLLSDVRDLCHLSPNECAKYQCVFQHVGYKLSSCCLVGEPFLVALAVFYFGYKHLQILQLPNNWEDALGGKYCKVVEILSDYMNAAYKFYIERTETMFQPSNSTPELKKETMCSLSCVLEQINALEED